MRRQLFYKDKTPVDLDRLTTTTDPDDYPLKYLDKYAISFNYEPDHCAVWRFDTKEERDLIWNRVSRKLNEMHNIIIEE